MGNCIGKNGHLHQQRCQHSFSMKHTSIERPQKSVSSYLLTSSTPLNTSSERQSLYLCERKMNDNETNVIQQTLSPSHSNDEHIFMHKTSLLSPVQLSSQCKKLKSSNSEIVFSENHIKQSFTLMTNEQDTSIGHLLNKENDTNKENNTTTNSTIDINEKKNVDIKVHRTDNDQSTNHQYFTLINETQLSNRNIMVNTQNTNQGN